ncbi:hypothetical protein AgCh_011867 [Apium graveolens]
MVVRQAHQGDSSVVVRAEFQFLLVAELKLKEQKKKIDERIEKEFGPISNQDKSVKHSTQLRQNIIDEMMLGNMERGQTSSKRHQQAIVTLKPKKHSSKHSNKNPMDLVYSTPKPDEKKLLAKREERLRPKSQKKQADLEVKKQVEKPTTKPETKKPTTITETEKHEEPKQKYVKRVKKRAKRKMIFEEKKEEPKPTQSTTTNQPTMPIIVQVEIKSKASSKPKPTVNKGDQQFIYDIKEFSDINLYLDELDEVRGIDAYNRLPERLVFRYKGGKEMTWPLHRILNEGYTVLVKLFSSIKKDFGFIKVGQGSRGNITILPTLVIHDVQYRGKVESIAILKTICAGFQETADPPICLSVALETNECLKKSGGCRSDSASNITSYDSAVTVQMVSRGMVISVKDLVRVQARVRACRVHNICPIQLVIFLYNFVELFSS